MASLARVLGLERREEPSELEKLLAEADRLNALLCSHEAAADAVRRALETARERESELPRLDADVVTGVIEAEVAEQAKREIVEGLREAEERAERHEALVAELRRRVAAAGQGACDEYLRQEGKPLVAARERVSELEAALEEAREVEESALVGYRAAEAVADESLAVYDREHAARRRESASRKERAILAALKQPRSFIVQLPLAWQAEAYERYDALHAEAEEYRLRVEQERYGGAPRSNNETTGDEDYLWRREGAVQ